MIDNRMKSVRKAKDVWYAWYPGDYAAKTAHLTGVQDGIYRRLLDHYYLVHGKVLANATLLLRVCRAFDSAEQAAVHEMLAEFFVERDGYFHHERADAELAKRAELRNKRAAAGSKGGKQKVANATILPAVCQTQSHTHSEQEDSEARASEPVGSAQPVNGHFVPKGEVLPVIELIPPAPPPPTPLDFKKQVFASGVPLLMENDRISDRSARGVIASWRQEYGDIAVMDALASAQGQAVTKMVPYVRRILEAKGKSNGRSRQFGLSRNGSNHPLGAFAQLGDELAEVPLSNGRDDHGRAAH